MTAGSFSLVENEGRQKSEQLCDESSSLLPSRQKGVEETESLSRGSFAGGVFNLSTSIVGAGIMSLPAAMKILGLIPGIAMIVFVAFFTEASIEMLIKFSRAAKTDSYGGVMDDAFGNAGRVLLQAFVVVNNFGVMIIYMIIIGDVLSGTSSSGLHHSGVLELWFSEQWWTARTFILFVVTLFVLAPLTCFKHVDSLRYTSAISVALAVVFVVITAGIATFKLLNGSIKMPRLFPRLMNLESVWNLFTVVPVVVTSYICHFNVHNIENELEDSSQMQPVVRTSLAFCSLIYIMTSFFGFLLFGESTLNDVLSNFDTDLGIPYSSFLDNMVRVSYVLHIMLVFPVIFFSLRLNMDGLLFPSSRSLASDNRRFGFLTAVLLSIIFLAANFIPSIWDAFQLTGATASVCLGFIFPAAIALRDRHFVAKKWEKALSAFMIFIAVFANSIAVYSDICSIFQRSKTSPAS